MFERWYEALIKTTVMMIGELDYGDIFYSASEAASEIGVDYHSQVGKFNSLFLAYTPI